MRHARMSQKRLTERRSFDKPKQRGRSIALELPRRPIGEEDQDPREGGRAQGRSGWGEQMEEEDRR